MTESTTYEIALRGDVSARRLRPLLDEFRLVKAEPGVTRLVGVVRDSSQLHGLVAHLSSLGLELLAIVPSDSSTKGTVR